MTVAELTERDLELPGGRVLHCYDSGGGADALTVVWHHGVPNIGQPPRPLFAAAERLGLRFLSFDRPGYGGSTQLPDRDVASAAPDTTALLDAYGVGECVVLGHSGGGPPTLACAALLGDRVRAAATVAGVAPFDAPGLDWYDGMADTSRASIRAAAQGRAAKEAYEAEQPATVDPGFVGEDYDALAGDWAWFMDVVGPAVANGPGAEIEDNLALVTPWGFDPAAIGVPMLFLHGGDDRVCPPGHSVWLAGRISRAELWLRPGEGHISVLREGERVLEWLAQRVS